MTTSEKVKVWRSRVEYAKEKRRVFYEGEGIGEDGLRIGPPGANFAIEVFRGNSRPSWWSKGDFWIHVGKLKAAVRAALPSLLYKDPNYQVYPTASDIAENGMDVSYPRSKAKALWLGHWWTKSHGTTHARIGIQNAFFDIGCAKAGYRCDFADDETRGVFAKNEDGEYILDANGDPTLERGEFLYEEDNVTVQRDADGLPVLHPGTVCKELFFVETVDCKNMLFDVDSGADFFQHRFVIEEWVLPLEEVKDNPKFTRSVRGRLKGTETVGGQVSSGKAERSHEVVETSVVEAVKRDREMIRGYDIYDFQNDEYLVLPEAGLEGQNDEFMLDGPTPSGMDHGPYRFLKYTENVGSEWYPIPDAIDMALVNQEYDMIRSQMNIHREHTKTRYGEMPNAFQGEGVEQEEEREKWATGGDATLLKLANAGSIFPLEKGQLDASFMQAVPNAAADFNEVGGMPGEMRGVSDADTATQASILATGAEIRNNDRRDNQVQAWLCEIGRVLLMSGAANAEIDTVVMEKVQEATGVYPFSPRKLTRDELIGEFEVTIEAGSTQSKSDPRKLQSAIQLLGIIGQTPEAGMFAPILGEIVDGMGLDPAMSAQIAQIAERLVQMKNAPAQGGSAQSPAGQQGQVLQNILGQMGGQPGVGSAQAGAPTGAPIN